MRWNTLNSADRGLLLFLFVAPAGYHKGAWRLSKSDVESLYGPELPHRIATQAETAEIHALLFADWLSFEATGENPDLTGYEPISTMAAVSAMTKEIGLVGTVSTTFWEPFHVARMLSQIDFLSRGRAGWNIVTSTTGAENFSKALPDHDERYRRAYEYLDVVQKLWLAWSTDAVLNDRERGIWADTSQIEPPRHRGELYSVDGPLLVPRSPQVTPLLTQAGGSLAGREFAARHAEVVYCVATNVDDARKYRIDVRRRAARAGRNPDSVRVLPGLMPIMGGTTAAARDFERELGALIQLDSGLAILSQVLHRIDLSELPVDEPVPPSLLPPPATVAAEGGTSRYPYFYDLAIQQRLSLRDLVAVASRAEGHNVVVGTFDDVAAQMRSWFEAEACDGFVLMPASVPRGLDDICSGLIPRLRHFGVLHPAPGGGQTLRQRLGLA